MRIHEIKKKELKNNCRLITCHQKNRISIFNFIRIISLKKQCIEICRYYKNDLYKYLSISKYYFCKFFKFCQNHNYILYCKLQ